MFELFAFYLFLLCMNVISRENIWQHVQISLKKFIQIPAQPISTTYIKNRATIRFHCISRKRHSIHYHGWEKLSVHALFPPLDTIGWLCQRRVRAAAALWARDMKMRTNATNINSSNSCMRFTISIFKTLIFVLELCLLVCVMTIGSSAPIVAIANTQQRFNTNTVCLLLYTIQYCACFHLSLLN